MGERCRRCCHCRSTPDDGVTDSPDPTGDEARTGVPIAVYIRAMSPDDVDVVSGIEARSFSDPWPPNAFTVLLRRAHARLRVAVDAQGSVVGYCALLIALDEREVANICVDPSVRGKVWPACCWMRHWRRPMRHWRRPCSSRFGSPTRRLGVCMPPADSGWLAVVAGTTSIPTRTRWSCAATAHARHWIPRA